jgi:hypothetical protein
MFSGGYLAGLNFLRDRHISADRLSILNVMADGNYLGIFL